MMKLARNIILASIATVAASCSDDTLPGTNPDNGERTPLNVAVALSNGTPLSRAEGKTFAANDELVARIRQVEWDGTNTDYISGVTEKAADQSPRLVLFKVTSNDMTVVDDNTQQTTNLTASSYYNGSDWLGITGGKLYWDDFSTASDPLTDANRYLQSAWGFCYNGGSPTTALSPTDGTLGWTATNNFDSAEKLRNNDLLWSKAQKPLKYKRGTFGGNDHGTLVIPYTHAMSMITIEVQLGDGFTDNNAINNTSIKLSNMYKSATFSAPDAKVTPSVPDGLQEVTMLKSGNSFQALVIPGKELALNATLAEITNIDGNNYKIPVTQTIINTWNSPLVGRKLKSGVNYKLTVTVAKQAIDVVAQITDWVNIEAAGTGEINFNADVTDSGVENGITNGSIDIFRAEDLASMNTMTTTATYNSGKWVNSPEIYWANGTQSYYFRALTEYDGSKYNSVGGSKNLARGHDVLWGTTKAHSGTAADGSTFHYAEGAAIRPRTGDVPLQFVHAMSKITINLSTSTTGILLANQSLDQQARAVDFTGAKITISNLCTAGTIAIADGAISTTPIAEAKADALSGTVTAESSDRASLANQIVIPQSLVNETYPIKLTITLGDGTTYSLLLKDCKVKDSADNYITTWQRGTHYVYEIYVEKEAIRFVAVIKEWEKVNGSGDANLDWD